MLSTSVADGYDDFESNKSNKKDSKKFTLDDYIKIDSKEEMIALLKKDMRKAANELNYELAAEIRDRIMELEL